MLDSDSGYGETSPIFRMSKPAGLYPVLRGFQSRLWWIIVPPRATGCSPKAAVSAFGEDRAISKLTARARNVVALYGGYLRLEAPAQPPSALHSQSPCSVRLFSFGLTPALSPRRLSVCVVTEGRSLDVAKCPSTASHRNVFLSATNIPLSADGLSLALMMSSRPVKTVPQASPNFIFLLEIFLYFFNRFLPTPLFFHPKDELCLSLTVTDRLMQWVAGTK